jgi:hypothetical protein
MKVPRGKLPPASEWPKAGWKHALNSDQFRPGSVFGWHEAGRMWSGIVTETSACSVKVKDVQPGVMSR